MANEFLEVYYNHTPITKSSVSELYTQKLVRQCRMEIQFPWPLHLDISLKHIIEPHSFLMFSFPRWVQVCIHQTKEKNDDKACLLVYLIPDNFLHVALFNWRLYIKVECVIKLLYSFHRRLSHIASLIF